MSQELEGTLTNEVNLVGTFGETGGGTTNYNDLINKPSINNVTLQGNKTGSQLGLVSSTDLATVATSGNYNDLINKPTIPAAQVNSDWNASSGVAEILNKPTLAAVATSGDYDDLTNKPTIPAAQVNSDWNSTSGVSEILNKPTVYQNAAELPISSSDTTNTKTYIDNKIELKHITGTTDSNGFLTTNVLATDYAFIGLKDSISHFALPLNAQSDSTIRLQIRNSSFNIMTGSSFDFYAWFLHTS